MTSEDDCSSLATCLYEDVGDDISRQEQGSYVASFSTVPAAIALYDFHPHIASGGGYDFDYADEQCQQQEEQQQFIIWGNAQQTISLQVQSDGECVQVEGDLLADVTSENNNNSSNVFGHQQTDKPLSQDGEVSTSTDVPRRFAKSLSKRPSKHTSKGRKGSRRQQGGSRRKKSSYKHVSHAEKPPHLVAKRNARERNRVHAVNLAFVRLRKAIPLENKRGKRVSKVKVLQKAISYIRNLHDMVGEHDGLPPLLLQEADAGARLDDSHLFAF